MNIIRENNMYDSSKKIILTYPLDTLLDKICVDLWSVIYKYRNIHYQIFIGNRSKKYPGYKKLKYDNPKRIFNEIFREIYRANNGYISLDYFKSGSYISFNDGYSIIFRGIMVTTLSEPINKLIQLEVFNNYDHEIVSNNMGEVTRRCGYDAHLCFFVMNEYPDNEIN